MNEQLLLTQRSFTCEVMNEKILLTQVWTLRNRVTELQAELQRIRPAGSASDSPQITHRSESAVLETNPAFGVRLRGVLDRDSFLLIDGADVELVQNLRDSTWRHNHSIWCRDWTYLRGVLDRDSFFPAVGLYSVQTGEGDAKEF